MYISYNLEFRFIVHTNASYFITLFFCVYLTVYNSRRSHSYATIDPTITPVIQDETTVKPPTLPASRPPKEPSLNILKNVFKWQTPTGNFAYNSLSQSTINSSGQSACTFVTEIDRESPVMPVNSLNSICEA